MNNWVGICFLVEMNLLNGYFYEGAIAKLHYGAFPAKTLVQLESFDKD